MNTTTTRLTACVIAVLLTVVTNGTVLMAFDNVARQADLAQSGKSPAVVTLDTVSVVTRRS